MSSQQGEADRNAFTTSAVLVVLLPIAVAVGIYLFGAHHAPSYNNALFGEHGNAAVELKAQLSTALLGLALIQLGLALWMYGRVPGARSAPRPVRRGHRALGFLAFLFSLPIAHHCLTTYGIETTSPRAAIHSFAGCALYGAFVAKVIVVRSRRLPGWLLPAMGALLVLGVALLWYTAALWALNGDSVPGFSSV
ncbi:DUF6529 family protein [Streptomyces sp. NBC_01022]|uniref:DUF6529 family protein n=1 Tax=Streptomyces sp. NBC_01022 TaxID=2903723 RepID=UPI002DDC8928|nr:DUF6529 family protein [Streptomyces sp. NBC_01022]WRZ85611.1 DUF6529 family protein [Streptomyces sp. NBC_01022]